MLPWHASIREPLTMQLSCLRRDDNFVTVGPAGLQLRYRSADYLTRSRTKTMGRIRSGLWVATDAGKHHAIDGHTAVMQVPGTQDALTLEAGPLRHPIRCLIADHDEGVQADRRRGGERPV